MGLLKVRKGSLVRHSPDGPVMTVDSLAGERARCTWFEDDVHHHGSFQLAALTPVDDQKRTWATAPDPHGGGATH